MASSTANPPTKNLATLLLIKQKVSTKNNEQSTGKQLPLPPIVTGAHSNEKLTYRQDMAVVAPKETTIPTLPAVPTEQPKVSRKTKQLEVTLLDKKMEEINRKQEQKTNEALDTWKGFDSVNYGFTSEPRTQKSTPLPHVSTEQQRTLSPLPESQPSPVKQLSAKNRSSPTSRQSSPKRVDSSNKQQPRPKTPLKEEEPRKETPLPQKTIEKQRSLSPKRENVDKPPSSSPRPKSIEKQPSPPSRRSKLNSAVPLEKVKSPEQKQPEPKPSTPIMENTSSIIPNASNPLIAEKNVPSFEQSPLPISSRHQFKLFPDIKHYEIKKSKNACRSIQRSMDRYRFHIW